MRKLLPSEQRETHIEKYLRKKIEELGGTAYKFTSPGHVSVPDRLCVLPYGHVLFVECKRPGKEPTSKQYEEQEKLQDLDQWVYWVDTKGKVDKLYNFWKEKLYGSG